MDNRKQLSMDSEVAQGLGWVEPAFGGLVPPIYMSATYQRDAQDRYPGGHSYTRDQNPSFHQPEALLQRLEGGKDCLLFSSGMAAATTIFDVLPPQAHVVAPQAMYFAIKMWMRRLAEAGRIRLTEVSHDNPEALESLGAEGPIHLLWLESPANPGGQIMDLRRWSQLGKAAGAVVVADNTLSTPILCQPLQLGADIVMHSASKQLNGHGDVVAGALVSKEPDEFWQRIKFQRGYRGAIVGPFESWLLLRGMRTLSLRVHRSAATALAVATFLHEHPKVAQVKYPALAPPQERAIAQGQMAAWGYVVSVVLESGRDGVEGFLSGLSLIKNASSLGSVDTVIEHRSPTEGPETSLAAGLLRLSIGIESPEDLIDDLSRALELP